jgi:Surface antigen
MRGFRRLYYFLTLSVIVLLGICAGDKKAEAAAIGDDYPATLKNSAMNTIVDSWGMYNRQCTSFVAYRLSSKNIFNLNRGGLSWNAYEWGNNARLQGYRVDTSPTVGSVAWYNQNVNSSPYGHVAWVSDVSGDNVQIEEYNYDDGRGPGKYNCRWVSKTSISGFIHFKDLAVIVNPQITSTSIEGSPSSGKFNIRVKTNTATTSVKVPIWSTNNGQDDVIWYEGKKIREGEFLASFDIANHKNEEGNYQVHAYAYGSGKQVGTIVSNQVAVSRKVAQILSTAIEGDTDTGIFSIRVKTNAEVTSVKVPIWSKNNGQDDITWYEGKKVREGEFLASFDIANHKYEEGIYQVHAYAYLGDTKAGRVINDNLSVTLNKTSSLGIYITTASDLAVRTSPSLNNSEVKYRLAAGEEVNVIKIVAGDYSQSKGWAEIIARDRTRAYISLNYLISKTL